MDNALFDGTIAAVDQNTRDNILDMFEDADVSIVQYVLYFGGWSTYAECGGYLIVIGLDGTIQKCEYGHCVMAEDNKNRFRPVEITHEDYLECVQEMEEAAQGIGPLC